MGAHGVTLNDSFRLALAKLMTSEKNRIRPFALAGVVGNWGRRKVAPTSDSSTFIAAEITP
jgi:hypothetical protein